MPDDTLEVCGLCKQPEPSGEIIPVGKGKRCVACIVAKSHLDFRNIPWDSIPSRFHGVIRRRVRAVVAARLGELRPPIGMTQRRFSR